MLPSTETAALLPEGDESTVTRTVLDGLAKLSVMVNAVVLEVVLIVELNVVPREVLVVKFDSRVELVDVDVWVLELVWNAEVVEAVLVLVEFAVTVWVVSAGLEVAELTFVLAVVFVVKEELGVKTSVELVTIWERTLGVESVATANNSSSITNGFENLNPYRDSRASIWALPLIIKNESTVSIRALQLVIN
jgi:hypothetical protein